MCQLILTKSGRYYEGLAKVLHEAGLYVSAVNPLLIKQYGNNSLRKVKTDKADSMKIAKYALIHSPGFSINLNQGLYGSTNFCSRLDRC